MTKQRQVYRCNICGNMVEVLRDAGGTLVCCDHNMELLNENTTEASLEKHVPLIENSADGTLVKVGSIEHPMEEKHHIKWVELHTSKFIYRKYLKAGEKPESLFKSTEDVLYAREYCNIHGLWKSK